jgi:hypothetical protein
MRDGVDGAVVIGNSIQIMAANAKHFRVLGRDLIQFDIHVEVHDFRLRSGCPSAQSECARRSRSLQRCKSGHSTGSK